MKSNWTTSTFKKVDGSFTTKEIAMKKIVLMLCVFSATLPLYSQETKQSKPEESIVRVFVEISPFLAAFELVSVASGLEFSRYQMGVGFTKGSHLFSHALNETTFKNYGTLHFLHNQSEEIFIKRYFKESRKGLYLGLLFNLTHWEVQNHDQDISVNKVGKYLTTYVGYRWFPLKNSVFYLEPNFGISARLNGVDLTQVGNQSFSFLQPPFELTPNVLMGAIFKLKK
jgi:hypothetical protein